MKALIGLLALVTILWLIGRLIANLFPLLLGSITGRILWAVMLKMGQQPPGMNEFANRLDKYFWKACRRHKLKLTGEARLAALMPIMERYCHVSKDKTRFLDWQRGIDLLVYQLGEAKAGSERKPGQVDATLVVKVLASNKTVLTSIFMEPGGNAAVYSA